MNSPAAGWYVNPSGPGQRYWDGTRWTEHIDESVPATPYSSPPSSAPPPPPAYAAQGGYVPPPPGHPYAGQMYPQPAQQGVSGLVIVGYVTAVVIPIVGFILGIVCATRRDEPQTARHGVWVIVLSVLAFVIWVAIISSNNSSYGY
jgi:hypothetical protein